jgi:electron transfer flavoprotein beta subunit
MKILVALKQVPARDSAFRPDASGLWIDESVLAWETNEPDAYALEAALGLKEKTGGGEVVAVTAGPERASATLREALAKGADRAIHIVEDGLQGWDSLDVARLLAAAMRAEAPDVMLTGLQSEDLGAGQTGVNLAGALGIPHATLVVGIEPGPGRLRVRRELEGGWFQWLELPLPALLTVQSGISRLRYATLMGIKRAKTKEVRQVTAAGLGVAPVRRLELTSLAAPQKSRQTQLLEGSAEKQAAALVEKLKFEARVL